MSSLNEEASDTCFILSQTPNANTKHADLHMTKTVQKTLNVTVFARRWRYMTNMIQRTLVCSVPSPFEKLVYLMK